MKRLEDRQKLRVDFSQLFRGHVEKGLRGVRRLLPHRGEVGLRVVELANACEGAFEEQSFEALRCDVGLGVVTRVAEAHPDIHPLPVALTTGPYSRFFYEAVFRELPKVKRTRCGRLANELTRLRRGQWTLQCERLE